MRKLLILMFVFGLVSSANAVIITFNSASGPLCVHGSPPPSIDVLPGAFVVVDITSDTAVSSGYLVNITESTTSGGGVNHSTALAAGVFHANFNVSVIPGTVRNAMTNYGAGTPRYMLIDRASAAMSPPNPIAAGLVLYQFELQIPATAVFCDTFTITAAVGFPVISPPPAGYAHTLDGVLNVPTNALTIHVIPEPATIALLGLGGLLLRRRK